MVRLFIISFCFVSILSQAKASNGHKWLPEEEESVISGCGKLALEGDLLFQNTFLKMVLDPTTLPLGKVLGVDLTPHLEWISKHGFNEEASICLFLHSFYTEWDSRGIDIYKDGFKFLEKRATQGNANAQYAAGLVLYKGWPGHRADFDQAYDYFLKAANQEHKWAKKVLKLLSVQK
jgi:hypothetical protein